MLVDVIILNWNAPDDTLACLRIVLAYQHIPLRIWVVDNASTDDSVTLIRSAFPQVHLLQSASNRGFAGGNNLALRRVLDLDAEYVLLLNNDATIAEADLQQLLEQFQSAPDLGAVGPSLWDAEEREQLLSAGGRDIVRYRVSHWRDLPADTELRTVGYVPGTCALLRADMVRAVGLLDEDYFFSGEVADLCMRARQLGWRAVVDVTARAYHHLARSSAIRDQLHIYYVLRNRFIFMRKFHRRTRWLWILFWSGFGLYVGLIALLHGQRRRARAIFWGILDGLRGRYGGQNARILGNKH